MTLATPLDFALPDSSIAVEPAEHRGADRSDVRMMVSSRSGGTTDDIFARIDRHLRPGDVLVVNTSATVPAAIDAVTASGTRVKLHLASPLPGGLWAVEVRHIVDGGGTRPGPELRPQELALPGGAVAHLLAPAADTPRLWVAEVEGPGDVSGLLEAHGGPIRYRAGPELALDAYQTVFALHPGSAEMPSAARPFTTSLVTRLMSQGVAVVPVTLHAGVSSYEDGETPGEERYEVIPSTADVVNALRSNGGRVVAVGTTVVRALETVTDRSGVLHPGAGLTNVVVTPERGVRAVDGVLTGWHEPRSSHLMLLEAFLSRAELRDLYERALAGGYLWHEFGDLLLLIP